MDDSDQVYPRPRGEALNNREENTLPDGLSPPTRGSHEVPHGPTVVVGSIPAHAGKPPRLRRTRKRTKVYPRPRGEARSPFSTLTHWPGLSPPTRGSLARLYQCHAGYGSIPAHAGKPARIPRWTVPPRVYPRPRGEAASARVAPASCHGLSPPTRGSLPPGPLRRRGRRSIPAHAGKPTCWREAVPRTRVYPRPRGEASDRACAYAVRCGLSPPTRGSRGRPASSRLARRVYPRPRGEAAGGGCVPGPIMGLSPPTRGSLLVTTAARRGTRSIPAHAGKPYDILHDGKPTGVYPRPRGEADPAGGSHRRTVGLSPPTRGSQAKLELKCEPPGSIPAHAGKPSRTARHEGRQQVYPRPRGEAPTVPTMSRA